MESLETGCVCPGQTASSVHQYWDIIYTFAHPIRSGGKSNWAEE